MSDTRYKPLFEIDLGDYGQCAEQYEVRRNLIEHVLVGTLYPSILRDECGVLLAALEPRRSEYNSAIAALAKDEP